MGNFISTEQDGYVATVTIDHPPVNALSGPLLEELEAEIDRLDHDEGVRAIVLMGATSDPGSAACHGAQQRDQDAGTDEGDEDRADVEVVDRIGVAGEHREEEATDEGPDYPDDDVADEAEAAAAHHHAGEDSEHQEPRPAVGHPFPLCVVLVV